VRDLISPTQGEQEILHGIGRFFLAALKPSADLGTRVGGGASGATSQLTNKCIQSKEANGERNNY